MIWLRYRGWGVRWSLTCPDKPLSLFVNCQPFKLESLPYVSQQYIFKAKGVSEFAIGGSFFALEKGNDGW